MAEQLTVRAILADPLRQDRPLGGLAKLGTVDRLVVLTHPTLEMRAIGHVVLCRGLRHLQRPFQPRVGGHQLQRRAKVFFHVGPKMERAAGRSVRSMSANNDSRITRRFLCRFFHHGSGK